MARVVLLQLTNNADGETNMHKSKEEYLMLREEILHLDNIVHNQISVLYVTVAYIFAFSINQANSMLFLITYVVILPVYLIVVNKSDGMYKISGYLASHLEGEKFNWENNLIKFNNNYKKVRPYTKQAYDFPFIFSSVLTTLLFFMTIDYNKIYTTYIIIQIIIACILFTCVILIFISRYKIKNRTEESKKKWDQL